MEFNDELKANVTSLVRAVLSGIAALLIYKGIVTEGQREAVILGGLGISTAIINLVWVIVKNRQANTKFETLRESPAGVTDAELKEVIQAKKSRKTRARRSANPYRPGDAPPLPKRKARASDDDKTPTQPLD